MIKGFIFDLDGTLVESTSVYLKVYKKVLKEELGLEPEEETIKEKFGKRATKILFELLGEGGIDKGKTDTEHIINRIRDGFIKSIGEVKPLPGAFELLEEAKKRYKVALATSSKRYATDAILERFGLRKYLDFVITSEDVKNAKPDPEIFLLAAERLGLEPEECIVFEDTIHGVEAAKASGARVVAVATGYVEKERLKELEPDFVFDTLKEFRFDMIK